MENIGLRQEILDLLPWISFFGGIAREELTPLLECICERKVEGGEYVYREGDPPGDLYILLRGELEFFILEEKVASGRPGILFGMSATIGIQKQLVSARAKTNLKLAVIPKKVLMSMRKTNPELFGKVMLNIARDLARDLQFLKDYVQSHRSV